MPDELCVRWQDRPSASGSTTATTVSPACVLAGTRIHRAAAAYGTPTLTPDTVPPQRARLAVVAGDAGIGRDGSRVAAVRIVSPVPTPLSSRCLTSALVDLATGSTPSARVASAGIRAACLPT